ncbi:MAG: sodium:proton antiporter [Magnetococcales bacterium]|nr:sodium:proton antiporter [Magnetococcales bacterium]
MDAALVTVALFVGIFLLVQLDLVDRGPAMLGGALAFLFLGWALDFYTLDRAVASIYFDSLSLLFGMSLISNALFRSGLFQELAWRTVRFSRGQTLLILVLLVLITYTISLFFTNLSVMVIMVPMTLVLTRAMALTPAPIVAAELVASNLGGASTLVGDFPNMIIGAVSRLHFDDFIRGMMAPCLILLAVLLVFFQRRLRLETASPLNAESVHRALENLSPNHAPGRAGIDPYLLRVGSWVLLSTLAGFFLAQPLGVQPSSITFVAGMAMLVLGRIPREQLFEAMSGGDLLFFLGLFVMVGGLQAAGVLEGLHELVVTLGGGSATLSLLVLMWLAGLLTPLLNAGPATAFLIPVAKALSLSFPGSAVWWALSLGVLAGSSASLSGATAGPVVASMMASRARQLPPEEVNAGSVLDFHGYLRWGLPIAGIFLGISSLYIVVITP